MPFINDKVLGEVALDLGRNGQIPAADLLSRIMPVVRIERYRRRLVGLRSVVTPTGNAGNIQWQILSPVDEMWRIIYADIVNANDKALVLAGTWTQFEGPGILRYQVFNRDVAIASTRTVVGPGAVTEKDMDVFIPSYVELPSKTLLSITAVPDGGTFTIGLSLALEVLIERRPKERSIDVAEFELVAVP